MWRSLIGRPPLLARSMLRACLVPGTPREMITADLDEEFGWLLSERSPRQARAWYRRQAWGVVLSYAIPKRFGRLSPDGTGSAGVPGPAPSGAPALLSSPQRPHPVDSLLMDLRLALRALARNPGFAVIAVVSLAVGIGVNAALFTVTTAMYTQPVPGITGKDRIVEVLFRTENGEHQEWSYPNLESVQSAATPIELLAGWKIDQGSLTTGENSEPVRVMYATSDYFEVLGVALAQGRGFLSSEDVGPGQHPVVVVSHDTWQNRLGGAADIVGQAITLNRTPYTVVGIAPEDFVGHRPLQADIELWAPLTQHRLVAGARSLFDDRASLWVLVLGRLRDEATSNEANAALETVFARLAQEYPEDGERWGARAASFGPFPAFNRTADMAATGALVAMVGIVLLIICGNVAGMMLARSATKEQEIAVRMALGSGRGRLVRYLLVEALVLALVGCGLGVLLAFWGVATLAPAEIVAALPEEALQMNGTMLVYSLVLTLATTLAVGLLPALRFSRPELLLSLKDDAGGGSRRVGRVHRIAASAQTGVALLLLVTGSLFFRAAGLMEQKDLGFEPENLLITRIDLAREGMPTLEQGALFMDRVRESIGSLPGVTAVSIADGLPIDLVGNFATVRLPDQVDEEGAGITVEFTVATEGFFEAIGTPVRGRGFEPGDDKSGEPVVVITQSLADRLWPGEEALGKQLRAPWIRDDGAANFTVVGVTAHVASSVATRDLPHIFYALRQSYYPRITIVVRTATDPRTLVAPLRTAILDIDPSFPIPEIVLSETLVERSVEFQHATGQMAGGLGLLALILSAIGLYGVVAFAVANRTREIGLRMALGATRTKVLRAVMGDALRLAVPGLVVGAVLAVGMATVVQSELVGLSPLDPLSFGAAAGLLLLVVLLASLVPARRASSIDPMDALRGE